MKRVDVEQGSDAWVAARLGIPTASGAHKILTPATRKPSRQADAYMRELLAEWLTGRPVDGVSTGIIERGMQLEDEARAWYEYTYDADVERVGFVTRDDGMFGGSPDGLVGDEGGLEIKVRSLTNHVAALLRVDHDHAAQIQSYLYLTDRVWWDRVYWHPSLPAVVCRMHRDDEWIDAFASMLDAFVSRLLDARRYLVEERNCTPREMILDEASGRVMPF